MLKYFFIGFAFLSLVILAMAGLRGQKGGQAPIEIFPDMDRQPKVKPQTPSDFFADGRAARPPVEGTVPLGYAIPMHKLVDGSVGQATGPYNQIIFSSSPTYIDTGKMGENWGTGIPFQISTAVMGRGQQRFRDLLRSLPRRNRSGKRHCATIRTQYGAKLASGSNSHHA